MAASGPADPESDIFSQFDVQGKGELVPGSAPVVDRFLCLLSPCHQDGYSAESRHALKSHREVIHGLRDSGRTKLPKLRDIAYWMHIGTPRPYEVPGKPQRPPRTGKAASLLQSLVPCGEAGMATSQPASLGSNIYEQFDVRHKEGLTDPIYICLLAPCSDNEVSFETYASWETHRSTEHMEPNDNENELPGEQEIRDWVAKNKPRPSDVPVKPKPMKERKRFLINPGVFADLDIRVTDEGKERYFCLLNPCSRRGKSYRHHRCWTNHRERLHKQSSCEDGEFTLPTARMIKAWVKKGKPVPFRIPPQLLPDDVEVYSGARPPTGSRHVLEERRLDPPETTVTTVRNVFDEIDFSRDVDGNVRFFCLIPNCVSSGVSFQRRKMLETHRIKVHRGLPELELLPSSCVLDRWLYFGKPRPYTPRGRGRPRKAAEGSTEREPARQKTLRSSGCSVAAIEEDPDHAASDGDSNGSL